MDKLRQSREAKRPEIIGSLLVDLLLLGPYPQSGFDSRPGHSKRKKSLNDRACFNRRRSRTKILGKILGTLAAFWPRTAVNSESL